MMKIIYLGCYWDQASASSESEHKVKGGLLLDVVVRKRSAVLELLSGEDESLLIGRDSFLVLDLSLDSFDGVRRLNIEGDGLSGEGLDEDLHLELFLIMNSYFFRCYFKLSFWSFLTIFYTQSVFIRYDIFLISKIANVNFRPFQNIQSSLYHSYLEEKTSKEILGTNKDKLSGLRETPNRWWIDFLIFGAFSLRKTPIICFLSLSCPFSVIWALGPSLFKLELSFGILITVNSFNDGVYNGHKDCVYLFDDWLCWRPI